MAMSVHLGQSAIRQPELLNRQGPTERKCANRERNGGEKYAARRIPIKEIFCTRLPREFSSYQGIHVN